MNYLITGIVFVLIFSLLVLVHEFGHFWTAKRAGIKVEEFGFGLPPRLWGKKKGETIYSINWIPFGGFVRMLGEDAQDPKMLKKKRSFAAQRMRVRVAVIVAGVVMNFLLAWVLMIIGFSVGMEPLLGPNDILPAVRNDVIELEEGMVVKEVKEDSIGQAFGFQEGDVVYALDGERLSSTNVVHLEDVSYLQYSNFSILRDGQPETLELIVDGSIAPDSGIELGVTWENNVAFPRVEVQSLKELGFLYQSGVREGDIILRINGHEIFYVEDLKTVSEVGGGLNMEIYRDGDTTDIFVKGGSVNRPIITNVLPDTPAAKAGFETGDIVMTIQGKEFYSSQELVNFVNERDSVALNYVVERDGNAVGIEVTPEDGRIGVTVSDLMELGGFDDAKVFNGEVVSSIVEIEKEQYPVHIAAYKAFGESWRLSKLTAGMFVDFVHGLFRTGEVPQTVTGPVGIAQLTHVFVQEGFIPILRFTAILSLSLAVINILPFPALDGGRLLFIIIEFIIGRRVNQKWESLVHALGYVLILLLILVVTYSDIMRIFFGG